jgi:hypothetical protein
MSCKAASSGFAAIVLDRTDRFGPVSGHEDLPEGSASKDLR